MRIAIVGPTHPLKGGIAQHTTALATHLVAAGHEVQIVSWSRQYPARLYPGTQQVDVAEYAPFEPTLRLLAWNRPDSWVRAARRLRVMDLVVFAQVTSVQAVPYRVMADVLRYRTRVVVLCHNVLPHERTAVDVRLVSALFSRADRVLVHTEAQQALARSLTSTPVVRATLPPHQPEAFFTTRPAPGVHRRLLFFGLVRPYKGLDVLLRALALGPPDIRLRVAGEFWGGPDDARRLCADLGLTDRVELRDGYVRAEDVGALFTDVDALVLPYRAATGSQAVWTAFRIGVPVIATRAGHLSDDIRVGVDGLLAEPDDVGSLAAALTDFYRPGTPEAMRSAVRPVDPGPYWSSYLDVLLRGWDGTEGEAVNTPERIRPPGGRALHAVKLAAEEALWLRVALRGLRGRRSGRRHELPTPVPPTDVLSDREQYERAVQECRRLGFPLHHDRPKNWDALGAVSTIVHTVGTDARVLDAGAARYSSVLPWLRILGVRDLVGNNLEFTRVTQHGPVRFEPGDITDTQYRDGWFDAIACMSVIEHGVPLERFLAEAARILRPGGVLVVSTDYDQQPPDTTGKTAYGTPVRIFGPEQIEAFVADAAEHGLRLLGDLTLKHAERPVHWTRTGLDYTFIRLAFLRSDGDARRQ